MGVENTVAFSLDNYRKASTPVFCPILKVREDDFSGLENRFHGQLRNRHPFIQFFKPFQDDENPGPDSLAESKRSRRLGFRGTPVPCL